MRQNREDYANPIDLTNMLYKGKENPLYKWVKEVRESALNEVGGRPNSYEVMVVIMMMLTRL